MKKVFWIILVLPQMCAAMVNSVASRSARSINFYLFRFDLRVRDNNALIAAVERSSKSDYFVSLKVSPR